MQLERKSKHKPAEVKKFLVKALLNVDFSVQQKRKVRAEFLGDTINILSWRHLVFFLKGIECRCCGLKGKYFAKERHIDTPNYHLNLYAINNKGEEVIMTKDHTVAQANGGRDFLENLEPMCQKCNNAKADNPSNVHFIGRTSISRAAKMLIGSKQELERKSADAVKSL